MKDFHLASIILVMIIISRNPTTSGTQDPNLGVNPDDTFTFEITLYSDLRRYFLGYNGTHFIEIGKGDSFSIVISDRNLTMNNYGSGFERYGLPIKMIFENQTFESNIGLNLGSLITFPDWELQINDIVEQYKNLENHTTGLSWFVGRIGDEFISRKSFSGSDWVVGTGSAIRRDTTELRYNYETGVLNFMYTDWVAETDYGDRSREMILQQSGYNLTTIDINELTPITNYIDSESEEMQNLIDPSTSSSQISTLPLLVTGYALLATLIIVIRIKNRT